MSSNQIESYDNPRCYLHDLIKSKYIYNEGELIELASSDIYKNDIRKKDDVGHYPLFLACSFHLYELTIYLIEKFPNAIKEQHGWERHCNPLHIVCRVNNTEMIRYLLANYGFLLHLPDDIGRIPLFDAVRNPTIEAMELLFEASTVEIINLIDDNGWSPMMEACSFCNFHVVLKLISYTELNISITDSLGYNAFHYLFKSCCRTPFDNDARDDLLMMIIRAFLDKCPTAYNYRGTNDYTILHEFALTTSPESAYYRKFLPFCHSLVNVVDGWDASPLHYACLMHNINAVRELCAIPSIDYNIRDHSGKTALHHLFVDSSNLDPHQYGGFISNLEVNVNIYDSDGNTALHLLFNEMDIATDSNGFNGDDLWRVVEIILERSIFLVLSKNNDGKTLLQLADEKLYEAEVSCSSMFESLTKCRKVIEYFENKVRNHIYTYIMLKFCPEGHA
jgi:ankyrin repeat protein